MGRYNPKCIQDIMFVIPWLDKVVNLAKMIKILILCCFLSYSFLKGVQNWEWSVQISQEIQFMKGPQKISCFRCIYLLVVYLLGKGVSWIGVTSKHWQKIQLQRRALGPKSHVKKNKIIHGGTSDFWIHGTEHIFWIQNLKISSFEDCEEEHFFSHTKGGERTTSEWPKLVSETIFFAN